MRLFLATLICLPGVALADTFTLPSAPGAVTVYSDAALVQRTVTFDAPAGQHEVILPGLPLDLAPDGMRVSLEGASLGATGFRRDAVAPRADPNSAEVMRAKEAIEVAEAAVRTHDADIEKLRAIAEGARGQIAFLKGLAQNKALPADVASLGQMSEMIGSEIRKAQLQVIDAELDAVQANLAREDLETDLKNARAALAALTPPAEEAAQLSLAMTAGEAGAVTLTLSYLVPANWQPAYDIYLTGEGASAALDLRRGAMVQQWSGEAWEDVALTLSTFALSTQLAPNEVFPTPLYLQDPISPQAKASSRSLQNDMAVSGAVMAEPVLLEEAATANFDGPGVTYVAGTPVSVASGVDAVRVALDTLSLDARRFARAAPRFDTTAFLMAEFTNTTAEPLLASRSAAYYLDNTLIGRGGFQQIPAGGEAELPFGPIEDLRLTYTVLDENEGDRGIIRRSNERTQAMRMDIQNIGATEWDVEVQAAVPYATQEDLEITWNATPAPSSQNINDKRGVLQWLTSVPAGTTAEILVETELKWPEGKVVR